MKSTKISSFLSRTGRAAAVLALAVCLAAGKDNTILSHAQASATVKAGSAKIRSSADKGSDVVVGVKKDDKLSVTGEKTDSEGYTWYEVVVDGSTKGYIRADLVDKSGTIEKSDKSVNQEEPAAKFTETSAEVTSSSHTSGSVIPDSANVRKGPATTDAVVGSVKKGTTLSITGEANGSDGSIWYQISFTNNGSEATGFILSDLVEPSGDAAGSEEETLGAEGEAGEGEPGSEDIPEEQPVTEPENGTEISNVVSSRIIPEGMDLTEMEIDAQTLEGWQSGNYFLLYTKGTDGSDAWYLYDIAQGTSQKIDNLVSDGSEDENEGLSLGGTGKLIVIILAALLIIMIIVCTVLFLKLRSDRWDDEADEDDDEDDEDDDDDTRVRRNKWRPKNFIQEDDEDEEDEEEDDEEVPVRRPVKRPVAQQPAPQKRAAAPTGARPAGAAGTRRPAQPVRGEGAQRAAQQGSRPGEPIRERPAAPRQGQPPRQQPAPRPGAPKQRVAAPPRQPEKQGAPVRQPGARPAAPKQRTAAGRPEGPVQKPAAKPVKKYQPVIDDDDEFEFGFLNMEGKDDL